MSDAEDTPRPHPLTLDHLNAATPDEFTVLLDGTYEHSPWIAREAASMQPFTSLAQLKPSPSGTAYAPKLTRVWSLGSRRTASARAVDDTTTSRSPEGSTARVPTTIACAMGSRHGEGSTGERSLQSRVASGCTLPPRRRTRVTW